MPLTLYQRGKKKIWHYRGTVAGNRLRGSCKTTDKAKAARKASKIEETEWKCDADGPQAVLTFAQAAELYQSAGKAMRFVTPIEDYLKDTLVKDITQDTIVQMAMKLYGHCSGASKNRMAIVPAQAVINNAAKSKLCQPLRIERFKVETKEKPHATLEWVKAFMTEASPQLGTYALLMFLTGARPTEGLECDVNLPGCTVLLKESKIGHERRAHLPAMLVAAIANLPKLNSRPIFFYSNIHDLRPAWDGAIKRAKIQRLTPHCCRHGFITMLLRRQIDVKTVSWLADVSPETLLKTYAHAIKDRKLTDVLVDAELTQETSNGAGNMLKTGTT